MNTDTIITPHNGTPTSAEAAGQIKECAATLRGKLLRRLQATPQGLTDEQMQILCRMEGSTQRPRRRELEQMGLVYKTITTRRTTSGRLAVVWKAA